MIELIKIIFLSAVCGITMLLPVPSLGHFSLLKEVFGFTDENFNAGFYYSVCMLAASLALYIFYAKQHRKIISAVFKSKGQFADNPKVMAYKSAGKNIFLSVLPLVILAVPVGKSGFVGSFWKYFLSDGSLVFVGISSVFCAVIMLIAVWYLNRNSHENARLVTKPGALLFGIYQLPAYIFPGFSHVAIGTVRTSLNDVETKNIFKEAYLYLAPAYLFVSIFRIVYYYITIGSVNIIAAIVGFAVSFAFSFLTAHIVNKTAVKKSYKLFAFYTLGFGLVVTATALVIMFA